MNGYMLFASCVYDDVPIRVYPSKAKALADRPWRLPAVNPLGNYGCKGFHLWMIMRISKGFPSVHIDHYEATEEEKQLNREIV